MEQRVLLLRLRVLIVFYAGNRGDYVIYCKKQEGWIWIK